MANKRWAAHCLLYLRRIEEIVWDITFSSIRTLGFGRCFPYDIETCNVGNIGDLVGKPLGWMSNHRSNASFVMKFRMSLEKRIIRGRQ